MEIYLDDFVAHEFKMLSFNNIKGIVPVKGIFFKSGLKLIYDSEYYPLIMKDFVISESRCKQIFKTLKTHYYTIKDYLLDYSKLDLDIENIMINSEDELAFIYLPKADKTENFFERMENLIMQVIGNMDNDEHVLLAMHKMGVKDKINEKNIDYFFELF